MLHHNFLYLQEANATHKAGEGYLVQTNPQRTIRDSATVFISAFIDRVAVLEKNRKNLVHAACLSFGLT